MSNKPKNETEFSAFGIDSIARTLLVLIQHFYNMEEGQKEYEAWQDRNLEKNIYRTEH